MRETMRRLSAAATRRVSKRLTRAGDEASRRTPMLSVVVTTCGPEDVLEACLADLSRQTLNRLQIVVVPVDDFQLPTELPERFATPDARVEVVATHGSGRGAGRNAGAAAAVAPYLAFLDAEDRVPPDAFARLVSVLERTGSDFAGGATFRDRNGRRVEPVWSRAAHRQELLRTSIQESPDALSDLAVCSKVFRREFWSTRVGGFAAEADFHDGVPKSLFNERIGPTADGVAYLDHLTMLTAYLNARAFDVVTAVTWVWAVREQSEAEDAAGVMQRLTRRLAVLRAARDMLAETTDRVRACWVGRVLTVELPILIQHALAQDDLPRRTVADEAAVYVRQAGTIALSQAPVDRKLLVALAAASRWDEVDDLLEATRLDGALPATIVSDGQIAAALPYGAGLGLSQAFYLLSEDQSRLDGVLCGLRWTGDGALLLEGWALIRGVDLAANSPTIELSLRELGGERSISLQTQQRRDPAATEWANDPDQQYDEAGFRVVVPSGALPPNPDWTRRRANAKVRWQLWVRVVAAGVERSGPIHTLTRFGTYDRLPSAPVLDELAPDRVVCTLDRVHGFVLEVRADAVRAVALSIGDEGSLIGTLRMLPALASQPVEVSLHDAKAVGFVVPKPDADDLVSFAVVVPPASKAPSLRLRTSDGQLHRVGWPPDNTTEPEIRRSVEQPGWQRSPRGNVQVLMPRRRCHVENFRLTADSITIDLATELLLPAQLDSIRMSSGTITLAPTAIEATGVNQWTIRFPLLGPSWPDGSPRSLPPGTYGLDLISGTDRLAVVAAPRLLERLPRRELTARHAVTMTRHPRSARFQIVLKPPLSPEERTRTGQRALQRWYRDDTSVTTEQVYFQCYRGEFATDSQRAIHDELLRRSIPLDLVWGVSDTSVPLPEGAKPVVIGSRSWYEAISRSRYLCSNVDFDRYLQVRPHQRFLQTFHGYPFKSMGISYWRSKGLTERAISYECERRNAAWSSILVPANFCADLYRENYRYRGEILVTGYPRDDALARPKPDVRTTILRQLGIDPGQQVVLYAPTWRESHALTAWTAKHFDEIDTARLADGLGPGFTILLRGHARTLGNSGLGRLDHAAIVDVTGYPEVNDLILAADVAVLDYSSLRFDWMITGKPMLFFVPDLDDYLRTRVPLLDYAPTAPGPLLVTTDELIDALRDLDRVADLYRTARQAANAQYNALNDGFAASRVVSAFFDEDAP